MAETLKFNRPVWLTQRNLRLSAGCVLFTFVTLHLLNAGMLLFGLDAAGKMRPVLSVIWESPPGKFLLYGSLLVHPGLALARLARRRTWRMPMLEVLQTALGLAIPLWLVRHAIAMRGTEMAGTGSTSYRELLWALNSHLGVEQALLVLFVWIHGCIGIAVVMRIYPQLRRWQPILIGLAVFIPAFALAGLISGIREVAVDQTLIVNRPVRDRAFVLMFERAQWFLAAVFLIVVVTILVRAVQARAGKRVSVRYADGPLVKAPAGSTLLEISRINNIPHASVCGGKARCSTCRVRVLEGNEAQPLPDQAERRLLAKIGAPDHVRLACQLRPVGDIVVQKLVDPGDARSGVATQHDPFHWGIERRITLMFADIRGFTTISERSFAFDIVFVLNRFQADMARCIVNNGGRVDKYLGDGLMAIFGVDSRPDGGSTEALRATRDMLGALEQLNDEFHALLGERLRIGVGLHTGSAILGRIGGDQRLASLTALGDTVNVAARLEEMTKTFNAVCVTSEATLEAATGHGEHGDAHEITVRGRQELLKIRSFATVADIPTV